MKRRIYALSVALAALLVVSANTGSAHAQPASSPDEDAVLVPLARGVMFRQADAASTVYDVAGHETVEVVATKLPPAGEAVALGSRLGATFAITALVTLLLGGLAALAVTGRRARRGVGRGVRALPLPRLKRIRMV